MWSYIKEHAKAFRIGAIGGFGVWFAKLPVIDGIGFDIKQAILRTIAAGCAAIATGLCAALAQDFYKYKIKRKLFKDKDDDKQERA